jgi:hypothetical protein
LRNYDQPSYSDSTHSRNIGSKKYHLLFATIDSSIVPFAVIIQTMASKYKMGNSNRAESVLGVLTLLAAAILIGPNVLGANAIKKLVRSIGRSLVTEKHRGGWGAPVARRDLFMA